MEKLFKYPALIVGIIAVITVFLGFQLPRAQLDNNNIRFLPDKNQAKIISEYVDETFGGQVLILAGLERKYQTVFEQDFLRRIRDFSQAVENMEYVKSVNSIMSTQYITGNNDSIVVSDLVPENFSGTAEEITELKRRIASWDLFRGSLVSDDLSATQILITLNAVTADFTRPEVMQSVDEIRKIADEHFTGEAQVYFTGQPIFNAIINRSMIEDNILLIPLVVVVILLMLFFSFKRFTYVALPFLTVIIAVVWTVGMAALLGIKLSVITTILPVILFAVGSAYGIHIVTHYIEDIREKTLSKEEHRILVLDLTKKLIKPVFLAALTTLAGFISFCFTPIVPMREFGYCAGFGVLASFAVAVLFIPAMFLLRGPRVLSDHLQRSDQEQKKEQTGEDRFSNFIAGFFSGIAEKKVPVLVCAALVLIISFYGLSKVIVDNAMVEFFQKETDISRSDRFIREYFGGSKDINLVVKADTTEELLHPGVLKAIDDLSVYLTEHVPDVGKVVGFADIIKRINQVFNAGESPDGLKNIVSSDTSGSFGFSDIGDFGFGSFGFSDNTPVKETPKHDIEYHDISKYNMADLLVFLDTASGKSQRLTGNDLVRELKRLTNYEGMAYYEIPSEPKRYGKETPEELQQLIANYLVLLAGDDDSGYSNDPLEPTAIRTLIQLRTTGNRDSKAVIDIIKEYTAVNFPKNVQAIIGGGVTYEIAITELIFNSQIISIIISVLIVFIIMSFSYKSPVAGFVGAVPLSLAILCNFAVMGFLGIKLSLGTALISSLAVGIGIDYTIHFIEFFKREYLIGGEDFLRRTYLGCGKAIIINALSVGAGFGVLALSQFVIIAQLGSLIALNMLITAFVSLTVIPALLLAIKPKFIYKPVT
jgi:uncharacterized protein